MFQTIFAEPLFYMVNATQNMYFHFLSKLKTHNDNYLEIQFKVAMVKKN